MKKHPIEKNFQRKLYSLLLQYDLNHICKNFNSLFIYNFFKSENCHRAGIY